MAAITASYAVATATRGRTVTRAQRIASAARVTQAFGQRPIFDAPRVPAEAVRRAVQGMIERTWATIPHVRPIGATSIRVAFLGTRAFTVHVWENIAAGPVLTVRGVITLPALGIDSHVPRSVADSYVAYALHELAHWMFTNPEAWRYQQRNIKHRLALQGFKVSDRFVHSTLNALEDVRIEARLIAAGYAAGFGHIVRALLASIAAEAFDDGVERDLAAGDARAFPFALAYGLRGYVDGGARLVEALPADLRAVYDAAGDDMTALAADTDLVNGTERTAEIAFTVLRKLCEIYRGEMPRDARDTGQGAPAPAQDADDTEPAADREPERHGPPQDDGGAAQDTETDRAERDAAQDPRTQDDTDDTASDTAQDDTPENAQEAAQDGAQDANADDTGEDTQDGAQDAEAAQDAAQDADAADGAQDDTGRGGAGAPDADDLGDDDTAQGAPTPDGSGGAGGSGYIDPQDRPDDGTSVEPPAHDNVAPVRPLSDLTSEDVRDTEPAPMLPAGGASPDVTDSVSDPLVTDLGKPDADAITQGAIFARDALQSVKGSPALRTELRRLFTRTDTQSFEPGKRAGRLNVGALARVATGAENVFARRTAVDGMDSAVSIVIDQSGSMGGWQDTAPGITHAARVASVLAGMFAQCVGVRTEILGFTDCTASASDALLGEAARDAYADRWDIANARGIDDDTGDDDDTDDDRDADAFDDDAAAFDASFNVGRCRFQVFKSFAEPVGVAHARLAVAGVLGNTPDFEALVSAGRRLLHVPAARRVLIMVTDGQGANADVMRRGINAMRRRGIVCIGLGIGMSCNDAYTYRVTVQSAADLGSAAFRMLLRVVERDTLSGRAAVSV